MVELPPWSYTMLDQFANCPKQAFHRYILKEKGPETDAMRKGNAFDKAVEARLKDGTPLAPEHAAAEPFAASLLNMRIKGHTKLHTQLKMGLTADFKPCAFFAADVWGRGALDVALVTGATAIVVDWKTGANNESKPWYNGGLQLKIFTLFMLRHFPKVQHVTAFNIYLKDNQIGKPLKFSRGGEATLWKEVLPKIIAVEKAFQTQEWPPCKGPLCAWCPVITCNFNPQRR